MFTGAALGGEGSNHHGAEAVDVEKAVPWLLGAQQLAWFWHEWYSSTCCRSLGLILLTKMCVSDYVCIVRRLILGYYNSSPLVPPWYQTVTLRN